MGQWAIKGVDQENAALREAKLRMKDMERRPFCEDGDPMYKGVFQLLTFVLIPMYFQLPPRSTLQA